MEKFRRIFDCRIIGQPAIAVVPLALAFIAGVYTLIVAAIHLRPLASDGANFVYGLLVSHHFVMDSNFFRYIDFLPQAPSVLILKILGPEWLILARAALMFSYSLITVLGTAISVWLCFRYKKPIVALGPLLAFGLVCLPTAAFSLSIVNNSLALFWPLFIIQMYGRRTRGELAALVALSALLAAGHETTLAFSALLLFFSVLQRFYLAIFIHSISLISYLLRLWFVEDWLREKFLSQTLSAADSNQVFLAAFLGIFTLTVVIGRFSSVRVRRILPLAMVVPCLGVTVWMFINFTFSPDLHFGSAVDGRATATVYVSLIALAIWLLTGNLPKQFGRFAQPEFGYRWRSFLVIAAVGAMLNGAYVDFRFTQNWIASVTALEDYVHQRQRFHCVQLERDYYESKLAGGGVADFCLSHLWAVIQPTAYVRDFVWVNPSEPEGKPYRDLCAHLNDDPGKIETNFRGPEFPIAAKGFKYGFRY